MKIQEIINELQKAKEQRVSFGIGNYHLVRNGIESYCTIGWIGRYKDTNINIEDGFNYYDYELNAKERFSLSFEDVTEIYTFNDNVFQSWDDAIKYFKELQSEHE